MGVVVPNFRQKSLVPEINEKAELGGMIGGLLQMMPQPELIKAVGVFIPRLYKKRPKLTKEMVPEGSILFERFNEPEDERDVEVSRVEEIK